MVKFTIWVVLWVKFATTASVITQKQRRLHAFLTTTLPEEHSRCKCNDVNP